MFTAASDLVAFVFLVDAAMFSTLFACLKDETGTGEFVEGSFIETGAVVSSTTVLA